MICFPLVNYSSGAVPQADLPKIDIPDSLGWDAAVSSALNLSQSAYSNWTKGGESALAWMLSNNSSFIYSSEKYLVSIDGKFLYGKTKIGGEESRKSEDRINLEITAQNRKPFISLFVASRAETQFDIGKIYSGEVSRPVSDFIDPLYLFQTAGIIYSYKKNFETRLGVSFKETITRRYPFWSDDPSTEEIEKVRFEQGLDSRLKGSFTLMKNLTYTTETKIFSTLESLKDTDMEFDNVLTAKVNKYVVVNFHYYVIYDRDASKRAQIFEGLALGLTFNMW